MKTTRRTYWRMLKRKVNNRDVTEREALMVEVAEHQYVNHDDALLLKLIQLGDILLPVEQ